MAAECRQRDKNVKGLYAQFLRENPKLINEPICNVVSPAAADDTISAAACMQWPPETEDRTEKQVSYSQDSTSRSDYKPHPSILETQRTCGRPQSTIKSVLEPDATQIREFKEKISFRHQYNCRTDPNEPLRGKLHGSFICS